MTYLEDDVYEAYGRAISERAANLTKKAFAGRKQQMEQEIERGERVIRENRQAKQTLERRIEGLKKIEAQWNGMGLGERKPQVSLKGGCFWVPASIRHNAEESYRVYGGAR